MILNVQELSTSQAEKATIGCQPEKEINKLRLKYMEGGKSPAASCDTNTSLTACQLAFLSVKIYQLFVYIN